MFNSFRANNKMFSAEIQSRTQAVTNGVRGSVTWTKVKDADCLFWKGGSSQGVFSEKIRAEVQAVCAFDPADVSNIADGSRIVVTDNGAAVGTFDVINADNIGGQGKILIVALKEYK